jgi:HPt (histidine-containing phosphotransfer) domain-containing protein
MLRTNLATNPFYNERAVRVSLAGAVIVVAALTAFNVQQVLALNTRNSEMTFRAQEAERETAQFTEQARTIRQALNTGEVTAMQKAAREANMLIERRVFSWTDLFNQFERTLPPDVRIAAVEPQVDAEGRLLVNVTVVSKNPEDLSEFMDRLEVSGSFRDVLSRQDTVEEEGTTRSIIQGYYQPASALPAGGPADTSDREGGSGNESSGSPSNTTPPGPERGQ